MTREKAIELLYFWQYGGGDSFTCKLYKLIMGADSENRLILSKAYPVEFKILQEWMDADSSVEWFKSHGYMKNRNF